MDKRVAELNSVIEMKEISYVKSTTELENRYEHKLADQLDRYDKLGDFSINLIDLIVSYPLIDLIS